MTTETRPALMYEGFCDGIDVSVAQVITNAQAVADDGFVFAAVKVHEAIDELRTNQPAPAQAREVRHDQRAQRRRVLQP